ncbi:DMT family transporter [Phreatobacter stygius]|uniref:DMT family transporter n=1 Tax=Phreatobacter stygius TaxID=1940610 RepID=A0A4D7BKC7_9HYPH|nr:DMT family transporter [Phreatobacter stygius]QCI68212.1 DMT family transporter [Phreatobacter stygius]
MSTLSPRMLALIAMATAVSIYGGQFVSVRFGLASNLSAYDIAALRFIFAGAVMLPFFIRAGVADCAGLGWGKGIALVLTGGFPLTVLSNIGLIYSPAAHASAIQPGMVAVTATTLAYLGMGARIPGGVLLGFAVVLSGLAAIAIAGSTGAEGASTLAGDLIFVVAGLGWGVFTWLCGRWQVPSVVGASIVSVLSMVYLPVYLLVLNPGLSAAPWSAIVFHGVNQGIMNVAIGLLLWTYGTRTLGVATAARFPPMIPVLGTLIGIPVLGEIPSPLAATGVVAIVLGLLIAATWPSMVRRLAKFRND